MEGGNAGEVVDETVDEEFRLHLADLWNVVVLFTDARFKLRHRVDLFGSAGGLKFLLHFADERDLFLQESAIFRTHRSADLLQVVLQVVEDACQQLSVFCLAEQLVEHLVGIVDGSEWFVRAGVGHASPRISPIRNHDTEFERSESRLRRLILLKMVLDFLVDGDAAGPARGRMRAALNVAWEQLDAGKEATDTAHVIVAVAPNAISHPVENESPDP